MADIGRPGRERFSPPSPCKTFSIPALKVRRAENLVGAQQTVLRLRRHPMRNSPR